MSFHKNVRSIATTALAPFPAIRLKAWSVRIAATGFCLFGALVLTASRIHTTKLAYELSEFHKTRQALEADIGRLEIERANLARPQRLAELARKMGLADPRSDQVIVMNE